MFKNKRSCYHCKRLIKRGGFVRKGKHFHKLCYAKHTAKPRRVPASVIAQIRGSLNGHRLPGGYRTKVRKRT